MRVSPWRLPGLLWVLLLHRQLRGHFHSFGGTFLRCVLGLCWSISWRANSSSCLLSTSFSSIVNRLEALERFPLKQSFDLRVADLFVIWSSTCTRYDTGPGGREGRTTLIDWLIVWSIDWLICSWIYTVIGYPSAHTAPYSAVSGTLPLETEEHWQWQRVWESTTHYRA